MDFESAGGGSGAIERDDLDPGEIGNWKSETRNSECGSLTSFGMTGLLEIGKRKMEIGKSGGAVEFDGGGVAEGVEDAERVG